MILLYASRMRLKSGKLRSQRAGPQMVTKVLHYGARDLEDPKDIWDDFYG
uniref:Uncharacterized protein n=1 Tax=Kalanchoe fedtschenkoi TaxID=63787 RepID=A0A7N0RCM8_KALFE